MQISGVGQSPKTRTPPERGGKRPDTHGTNGVVSELSRPGDGGEQEAGEQVQEGRPLESLDSGSGKIEPAEVVEYLLSKASHLEYGVETKDGWRALEGRLIEGDLEAHYRGTQTLGVFPTDSGHTWFICFDLDDDGKLSLLQLQAVLKPPYLVEHTGGRGAHVWVFFEDRTPVDQATTWASAVLKKAGVKGEHYPKTGGAGLIRLPLGIHRKTGKRSEFVMGTFGTQPCPDLTTEDGRGTMEAEGKYACLFEGELGEFAGRNAGLYSLRSLLEWKGIPSELAVEWVRMANDSLPEPLPVDELERTVLRPELRRK